MQQLKVAYDFLNNFLPIELMSLFTRSNYVHPDFELNSSINNLLYIPRVITTTYGIKSVRYHCAKLWNDYFKNGSIQVKDMHEKNSIIQLNKIRSVHNFKNALKRHFIHQYQ